MGGKVFAFIVKFVSTLGGTESFWVVSPPNSSEIYTGAILPCGTKVLHGI